SHQKSARSRKELLIERDRASSLCKETSTNDCFRTQNHLLWPALRSRGRSREGIIRILTALVVGGLATVAAVHLFITPEPQGTAPLADIFAGRTEVVLADASEAADPAPDSITISLVLDRTAPVAAYLKDAGIDSDEARRWSLVFQSVADTR